MRRCIWRKNKSVEEDFGGFTGRDWTPVVEHSTRTIGLWKQPMWVEEVEEEQAEDNGEKWMEKLSAVTQWYH